MHRDIKIENVVLDGGGRLRLIDFGMANDGGSLSMQCGTPSYMSPEMCRRESAYSGEAADVWALGVLFYVSVVGKYPFVALDEE